MNTIEWTRDAGRETGSPRGPARLGTGRSGGPVGRPEVLTGSGGAKPNTPDATAPDPPQDRHPLEATVLYRKVVLTTAAGALAMGLVLVILVVMSWRSVQRIEPIGRNLELEARLQAIYDGLSENLVSTPAGSEASGTEVRRFLQELEDLLAADGDIGAEAAAELQAGVQVMREAAARRQLTGVAQQQQINEGLRLLRHALRAESKAQRTLYNKLREDNERQLQAALALAVLLPLVAIGSLTFFRRRVLAPLDDLSYLMGLLARKDYTLALTERIDPPLRPLFEKYNRMVKRMRGVEAGHVKREDALQREVDSATRAVFQQHVALARADRLAALGEMSARVAHELRNPLSGVLMALINLAEETQDPEQRERLQLAVRELERVGRLLSGLVEDAKQMPESPRRLRLATLLDELFQLLRYRLPEDIALTHLVPADMECILPEAGLRQAMINLILNAAEAMEGAAGKILVTAQKEGGEIGLCVCDSGPGFPAELLQRGIQEFGTGRPGGTGLGLASVRRFISNQGGRLELFNRDVGGGCVLMSLPQGAAYA
jgi:two-component system, NtrC family, sensor kinase